MNIDFSSLHDLSGLLAASLVDSDSGMVLGAETLTDIDVDLAAAGNMEVVRATRRTMSSMKMSDGIDDILICLNNQYHIIRMLESDEAIFIYVVLDRRHANLALARVLMRKAEKAIRLP